uniref:Uncharacterized protein n=1 Tax=Globodera rostochiensis TaxID=31243 RepID=A0A914HWF5_GLORO
MVGLYQFSLFICLLGGVTASLSPALDLIKYGLEKAQILACKLPTTCGCGYANCIETPGKLADFCCQDGYTWKCCETPKPPTTLAPVAFQIDEKCKNKTDDCNCTKYDDESDDGISEDGHWGSCVRFVGWTGDACCGEGYTFKCCEKVDLIEAMDKKDECQSSAAICLCGFDAFDRVDKRIAGMCCDGGTCLCCSTVFFTDPALKQIPKVMRDHSESAECKNRLPCGKKNSTPVECTNQFACHSYCVWNEGFSGTECCPENYTLRCWNQGLNSVIGPAAPSAFAFVLALLLMQIVHLMAQ